MTSMPSLFLHVHQCAFVCRRGELRQLRRVGDLAEAVAVEAWAQGDASTAPFCPPWADARHDGQHWPLASARGGTCSAEGRHQPACAHAPVHKKTAKNVGLTRDVRAHDAYIELGTSCTQSKNHTTRPASLLIYEERAGFPFKTPPG